MVIRDRFDQVTSADSNSVSKVLEVAVAEPRELAAFSSQLEVSESRACFPDRDLTSASTTVKIQLNSPQRTRGS